MMQTFKAYKYLWFLVLMFTYSGLYLLAERNLLALMIILLLTYRFARYYPKLLIISVILTLLASFNLNASKSEMNQFYQNDKDIQEVDLITYPYHLKENKYYLQGSADIITTEGRQFPVVFKVKLSGFEAWSKALKQRALKSKVCIKLAELETFRNFYVFDYSAYLNQQQILGPFEIVQVNAVKPGDSGLWSINRMKQAILFWLNQRGTDPLISFFNKMFFNIDSLTYQEAKDELIEWGIIHFFAISGFHVSLIIRNGEYLLRRFLPRIEYLPLVLISLLMAYGWLISWPVGAFRAIMTYLIANLVRWFKLPLSGLDQLSLLALCMLVYHPVYYHDLAYILSFLMAFILFFYQQGSIEASYSGKILNTVVITLTCSLFSWPILINVNHQWNPLQLLAVIVFSLLFDLSFFYLLAIIGLVFLFPSFKFVLADVWSLTDKLCFPLWQSVKQFYQAFNYHVGQLSLFWWIVLMVGAIVFLKYFTSHQGKRTLQWVLVIYIFFWSSFFWPRYQGYLTILDVGQGDATLFQPAMSRENWLIDTGGKVIMTETLTAKEREIQEQKFAQRSIITALKALGVQKIDYLVLTHLDQDHCGNLAYLVEEFQIGQVILSLKSVQDLSASMRNLMKTYPIKVVSPGEGFTDAHNQIQIHYPPTVLSADRNDHSLMVRVSLNGNYFWSLADLSQEVEDQTIHLLSKEGVDYLKLSHHGSAGSSSEKFLKSTQAKMALISVGQKNYYGHPSPQVLERLDTLAIPYYSTAESGALRFIIEPFQQKVYFKTCVESSPFNR